MTYFTGTELLFDSENSRMVRTGHPESKDGTWIVEFFGDCGWRRSVDTRNQARAQKWLRMLKKTASRF